MNIREYLSTKKLVADGAMGTYYATKYDKSGDFLCELCNIDDSDKVLEIHKEYIYSGARLLRTNTFAANSYLPGISRENLPLIIKKGCAIARQAIAECDCGEQVFVAGDIGPIHEDFDIDREDIINEYKYIIDIFLECEVDTILFETFADMYYLNELIDYIKSKSNIFVITNFSLNKNGYTTSGISAQRLINEAGKSNADACGFNCGIGSGHMKQQILELTMPGDKLIVCMPNAGYPEQMQNRMIFMDNSDYFVKNMLEIADKLDIIGGCCGSSPRYIEALSKRLDYSVRDRNAENVAVKATEIVEAKQVRTNSLIEKFSSGEKVIAVEVDPPYDSKYDNLIECARILEKQKVDMITMADSPMGRSRVDSVLMSLKIREEVGINVMPHICCRDRNMISMRSTLLGAYINDVRNLLIVTGDPVPNVMRSSITGVFDYNSIQLMNFVKEMNMEHFSNDPFVYGGALNVSLGNVEKISERVRRKMDAGATFFMTQPVFSDEDINRLGEIKAQTGAKILCGIMPFVSLKNAKFMQNEFIGINVPDSIVGRYNENMTRAEAEQTGADIAAEIIAKLGDNADGYYFMFPFNRVSMLEKILKQI